MVKHRSFKIDKFLKSVDTQLRNQYFSKYKITLPADVNFDDGSFDKFWSTIKDEQRDDIEEELRCINDIADHARDCLERACQEFKIQKQEEERAETTALRVFLDKNPEAYLMALDAYLYYVLSERCSRHKFNNGKPDFNSAKVSQFKSAVEQHFKNTGKSEHCVIRQRIDGNNHIFFIARGDFRKTYHIFDEKEGKPDIRSFRPAKEDMLAFDKQTNILCLSIDGRCDDDKKKYLEMFGGTFMGLSKIDESTLNNLLVNLDPIKKRTFHYEGNEQIESVKLTEVNAKLRGGALRLSIRSHDLKDTIQGFGLASDNTEYISVKLNFLIKRDGKKSINRSVIIKPPENSKIPQRKEKQIIEAYLREQGVLLE